MWHLNSQLHKHSTFSESPFLTPVTTSCSELFADAAHLPFVQHAGCSHDRQISNIRNTRKDESCDKQR
jgi:hypothetical protein